MTPEEARLARRRLRRRIARLLRTSAGLARRAVGLSMEGARIVGRDSAQRWRGRRAARHAELDRLNRTPLPSLYQLHPEARGYMRREVGLRSIPLEEIGGTAVAGQAQRGSDFTPMRQFRNQNWEARWQRINRAVNDLTILPPIDVLKFGDRYWVEDGHNRVAGALRNGQVEIDAAVIDLRAPTRSTSASPAAPVPQASDLAGILEEGRELRAAGEGRFSAQAASLLASSADDAGEHGHDHRDGGAERPTEEPSPEPDQDVTPRRRIRRPRRAQTPVAEMTDPGDAPPPPVRPSGGSDAVPGSAVHDSPGEVAMDASAPPLQDQPGDPKAHDAQPMEPDAPTPIEAQPVPPAP